MEFMTDILADITLAAVILGGGWIIGNWAGKAVEKVKKIDTTLRSFLAGLAKYAIYVVAIITVLTQFGIQTTSLIAVLGAAGLAIGLALQGTLSNVSAGVMLLFLRPFSVGDTISFGDTTATVKTLGLFVTELTTADNIFIFTPNSNLWNTEIQNLSRNDTRRQDIPVGISYDDDIDKAFKTIHKVLDKEERLLDAKGKEPQIMVSNMGESSVDLTVRLWTKSADLWGVKWDLNKAIKEALDKDGITIPYPTRTIETVDSSAKAKKKAA